MDKGIELKKYLKVIYGMALIIGASSLLFGNNIILNFILVLGTFLLLEHIYTWEEFSVKDFIGHEYLGFILILIVFLFRIEYTQSWIAIFLVGCGITLTANFQTKLKNEFKLLK